MGEIVDLDSFRAERERRKREESKKRERQRSSSSKSDGAVDDSKADPATDKPVQ